MPLSNMCHAAADLIENEEWDLFIRLTNVPSYRTHLVTLLRESIELSIIADIIESDDWDLFIQTCKNPLTRERFLACLRKIMPTPKEDPDKGYDVKEQGLHACAECNYLHAARTLLQNGADVNKVDELDRSPLLLAVSRSNTDDYDRRSSVEMVQLLCEYGADVNYRNKYGHTPIMSAAGGSRRGSSDETLKTLLKYSPKLDIQDNYGNTALMTAILNSGDGSSPDTVKILIQSGADLYIKNNAGKTAIHLAAETPGIPAETLRILLEATEN